MASKQEQEARSLKAIIEEQNKLIREQNKIARERLATDRDITSEQQDISNVLKDLLIVSVGTPEKTSRISIQFEA